MRILVSGPPRSGTTWVAEALTAAAGAIYVHEPDNPDLTPLAVPLVKARGLVPVVGATENCPEHDVVWRTAFRARWNPRERSMPSLLQRFGPQPKRVVVKSVHAGLSIERVVQRHHPHVVLVRRNPLGVIASWLRRGWFVPADMYGAADAIRSRLVEPLGLPPPPAQSRLARLAWWTALLLHVQELTASRHPDWIQVTHEEACLTPGAAFSEVLARLEMEPLPGLERYLAAFNRPGEVPKGGMAPDQVDEVVPVLQGFPPASWQGLVPASALR